jgi:1-aminocyclopropane-1-carboxylate deaminase/D-cysteine desulfhydrase-like pyridoxal-dependent ACC family enzyme
LIDGPAVVREKADYTKLCKSCVVPRGWIVAYDEAKVEVVAWHAGPAYGVPHEATVEAIRLAVRLEALPVDPVYSGKGLAGLIATRSA